MDVDRRDYFLEMFQELAKAEAGEVSISASSEGAVLSFSRRLDGPECFMCARPISYEELPLKFDPGNVYCRKCRRFSIADDASLRLVNAGITASGPDSRAFSYQDVIDVVMRYRELRNLSSS